MHHHVTEFIAQLFFLAMVHGGPVPPARVPLETLERPAPTYESVMADLTVANWKEIK
jgi:hypothetical protein